MFFTADTHFGHDAMRRHAPLTRPFPSCQSMDEFMVESWNKVVHPSDIVYHLGDFTLSGPSYATHYFSLLNGRIYVVPGGHDRRWTSTPMESKSGYPVTILPLIHILRYNKTSFVLCHYPLESWPLSHYNSLHLHGHSHGKMTSRPRRMDVGVDSVGFCPLPIMDILL